MPRRRVQASGHTVWISDDEPVPSDLGWWALLRTRVIDEVTEVPPHVLPRIVTDTPRCAPRVSGDGVCGLVARPRDVSSALVTPGALRATIEVDGYLPQVLDAAIDGARRQLPAGAAAGNRILTIAPAEPADRPQFQPGRGVMLERTVVTDPEQFARHADPAVAPAANQVPIDTPVAPGRPANVHVAGVPILLGDQRLHRAEPVRIRGRALRQAVLGSSPVAAPGAHIGISGVWWTQREVVANSVPPHPARIVSFDAPLMSAHPTGSVTERITTVPDGIARTCRDRALAGERTIVVHPWGGLQAAGGDVLQLEADNSFERELVITDGFDDTINAVTAAVIRLRAPLAFPHITGAPIMRSGVAAAAIAATEREAIAGDRVLFVTSMAGLANGDVLRVGGAGARGELRFIFCQPTYDGAVFANETTLDASGNFELPPIARIAQAQFHVEHAGHPLQLPVDFVPEPGADNVLQVLLTP